MPLRYTSTSAALHRFPLRTPLLASTSGQRCCFHASPCSRATPTNHYETLNVHPDASAAEIKKSFYTLSKRYHPDHNPTDPHAPTRFMRISEAYAVLGHADKRARYDRDVLRRSPHHGGGHPRGPGSYHSTGPAGGRPASGLSSRRRGTFQGPPPSFFRSGGWGAHGAKRRAAHEESTGGYGAGYGTDSHSSRPAGGSPHHDHHQHPPPPPPPPPGYGGGAGGMGPGQSTHTRPIYDEEIPHFDRAAHERAQRRGDERRAQRMAEQRGLRLEPDSPTTMSFWAVAAILAAVVSGPLVISWVQGLQQQQRGRNQNHIHNHERAERERGKEMERKGGNNK